MKLYLNLISIILLSFGQENPFLNQTERLHFINELSGDRSFEDIRILSQWHRNSGMDGYFEAAEYIMKRAKEIGFTDVKFYEQDLGTDNYTPLQAELWISSPISYKLADIGDHALYLADGSHSAEIKDAELVFVGKGTASDLEPLDVKGKIVLTEGYPYQALFNAVKKKGALGVICFPSSEGKTALDFPDQVAWVPGISYSNSFAFVLSPRQGIRLKELLASKTIEDHMRTGQFFKGGSVKVSVKVKTKFDKQARTGFVEAWIRGKGKNANNEQIVLTAHLQEEQGSANDDASGCANLLEIGRTLIKLIKEGKIEEPERDIRFWWTDEIESEYQYFGTYPNEIKKILANLHQDMVGAKQSVGSRVQHLIYAPHSITSYLDAVFESVCDFVIKSNNPYLAVNRFGKYSRPHAVEIYSKRGSREGYAAKFVPFFNASDNLNFVEGVIGIPSVALINWDDYYIHSFDDDLWQIDQTQLKRNAFIIASMTHFLSKATEKDIPVILSATVSQGMLRLANDLRMAYNELKFRKSNVFAYKNARILIEQGTLREIRAVNSISVFDKNNKYSHVLDRSVEDLKNYEHFLNQKIDFMAKSIDENMLIKIKLTKAEKLADEKIPVNISNVKHYFASRKNVNVSTELHPTMKFELFNFVNGKRSYYDIYKALKAENLAASEYYYGEVSLEDVVKVLNDAVKKNVLKLK